MADLQIEWLTPDLLSDPTALHRVRVKDGQIAICDVISTITGQTADASRRIWSRTLDAHPTLSEICGTTRFPLVGPGRPRETPTTDAKGIVQILMVLPGRTAAGHRQAMSEVIVRYLGGDPSLVDEIYANRQAQLELAAADPENPMRIFGEAVENDDLEARQLVEKDSTMSRIERKKADQDVKFARLQRLEKIGQTIARYGPGMQGKFEQAMKAAIEDMLLPPGEDSSNLIDAADWLRIQGHSELEVSRLAGEFGKLLKLRRRNEGGGANFTSSQTFGPDDREVLLYNRVKDREFLASAYEAFKQRPLYQRVCPTNTELLQRALQDVQNGRGMPRPKASSSNRGQRSGQ